MSRGQKRAKSGLSVPGLPKVYQRNTKFSPWVVSWRHDGKRERFYFSSEEAAKKKAG
jgi:hypothetical protein